mgnify:CR=1 FL=1
MDLLEIILISIALALDASGVSVSMGIDKKIKKSDIAFFIISFGFFQFLFSFLGGYFGILFNEYVFTLPCKLGGFIIFIVGILMIKEGFCENEKINKFTWYIKLLLGISVSIDAFVVGFSVLNFLNSLFTIFRYSIIIGIITSFMTSISFKISTKIGKMYFVRKYADFLGGIILVFFGIKMMFF